MELYDLCKKAGLKNGVVQDKLWLPGIMKLKTTDPAGILWENTFGKRRIWILGI